MHGPARDDWPGGREGTGRVLAGGQLPVLAELGAEPPSRGKLPVPERVDRLESWRTLPGPEQTIGVPCALCGRPACGFYGKVDVPLGASTAHRNTTARGHEGLALCRGCLASFHALPYGCAIAGGRAAVLHSWDERFMAVTVAVQVHRMRQNAAVAAGGFGDKRPYARQVAALHRIRAYEEELTAGVELVVFSNSNKEQTLDVHAMGQPLAEWLRFDPSRLSVSATAGVTWRVLTMARRCPACRRWRTTCSTGRAGW